TRDFPINGDLTFTNVRYTNFAGLIGSSSANPSSWDALLEGNAKVAGPAMRPAELNGTAELTRTEFSAVPTASHLGRKQMPLTIKNDGPIAFVANQSVIQVQRAHWVGPATDITLRGTIARTSGANLDLAVNANTDLAVIHDFDQDISSEGKIVLKGTVR